MGEHNYRMERVRGGHHIIYEGMEIVDSRSSFNLSEVSQLPSVCNQTFPE